MDTWIRLDRREASSLREDVFEMFDDRGDPAETLTTPEVAKALGASQRTVFNRFDALRERDEGVLTRNVDEFPPH